MMVSGDGTAHESGRGPTGSAERIRLLEDRLEEREAEVRKLQTKVRNLEMRVREKRELIARMTASRGWRLLEVLRCLRRDGLQRTTLLRGLAFLKREGAEGAVGRIVATLGGGARHRYNLLMERTEPREEDLARMRGEAVRLRYRPLVSIAVPVYNVKKAWLRRAVESVRAQVYDRWELCLVDGASTFGEIGTFIREEAARDRRIKFRLLNENRGIAGNTNEALALATGEYVAFLDHDDELAPHALYEVVRRLNDDETLDIVYTDEDKISGRGRRFGPHFKPDWSPDTLRSYNYICHLTVIRRKLLEELGGLREGFDGAQDYDILLRASEVTGRIGHIAGVLYHWRHHRRSTGGNQRSKTYAYENAKRALREHLERTGVDADVEDGQFLSSYRIRYAISSDPPVGVIIPNRDQAPVLRRCVESVLGRSTYGNYTLTIVDNQSREEETFRMYREFERDSRVRILSYQAPFNFSAVINYAVSCVDSEYVLFLNNDTEVIAEDWLEAMMEFSQRSDVGAVGAKLYYPNETVQHGGVILGIGGVAGHLMKYARRDSHGYFGRLKVAQNLSAVTAACMLTRRSIFDEVGGFDETYSHAFNDVDYCLKLRERGYLVIFTPFAELYHHESLSRGYEDTPDKQMRFKKEIDHFQSRWAEVLRRGDPYYNRNLTLKREDFSVRLEEDEP